MKSTRQQQIANYSKTKILEYAEQSQLEEKELYDLINFIGFKRLDSKSLTNFLVGLGQFSGVPLKFACGDFLRDKDNYADDSQKRKIMIFTKYLMSKNTMDDLNEDLGNEIRGMGSAYNKVVEEVEEMDFDHELRKLEDELNS